MFCSLLVILTAPQAFKRFVSDLPLTLQYFFMFVPLSYGTETAQYADYRINCVMFLMLKNLITVDFRIVRFYIKEAPFWVLVFSLSYAQGVM